MVMLIFKNSLRKIRKSLGRFLSLILIVILGTSFFAGVRETASDMIKTLDHYYDETSLYDFKIISTMGLTEDDLASVKDIDSVEKVEGAYSFDTLVDGNVIKVLSLTDEMNKVTLVDGSMPTNNNECLVEDGFAKIGDEITLGENSADYVKNDTYKVVGTINSSSYIYDNKGIATVGDGKLDSFIYILKDNFDIDYYTELYILAKDSQDATSYLDDYKEIVEGLDSQLQELRPLRETARYEEILQEAMSEIISQQEELEKVKATSEQEFQEAKNELDQRANELADARIEYQNAVNQIEAKRREMDSTFSNGFAEIASAREQINTTLSSLNLTIEELDGRLGEITATITALETQLESLDESSVEYQTIKAQVESLTNTKNEIETLINTNNQINNEEQTLIDSQNTWNNQYNSIWAELNSNYQSIKEGEEAINAGYQEYDTNYNQYLEEIANYEAEIAKAKDEVNSLEKPVWYLLTREDITGYTAFYESATKVDSIAQVFPIFFILIAFLMSLNTMSRMVEEQRSEIGAFISLGIRKSTIAFSYLLYVLLACVVGLIVGLVLGYTIIPHVLYTVYAAAFTIPDLITYANPFACILIIVITLILMSVVTLVSLSKYFRLVPATVLRPEAPKVGKKIFLERISILWNRLSFSWKVTLRNLFRYKKRIIMTVIGIAGCTALLLTGFGIRDSLNQIMEKQFDEIQLYDAMFLLNEEIAPDQANEYDNLLTGEVKEFIKSNVSSYTFKADNKNLDFTLISFMEDEKDINDYVVLKDLEGNPLSLSDNGAIITEKMAENLNAKVGSNIEVRNSDNELFIIHVVGICENYINNYLYMNETYYEEVFGNTNYNAYLANLNSNKDQEELANHLLENGNFTTIQFTADSMDMFYDIIGGMNNIVYLIIAFSTFLAITVLYNLTIININERTREIATLKVLGFRDKEVSTYVYRETIILTIIGIIVGIFLGFALNSFVLMIAETDEILFTKEIALLSYILTFVIIILFSVIVQIITYFILRKIDMIDSLKSVE